MIGHEVGRWRFRPLQGLELGLHLHVGIVDLGNGGKGGLVDGGYLLQQGFVPLLQGVGVKSEIAQPYHEQGAGGCGKRDQPLARVQQAHLLGQRALSQIDAAPLGGGQGQGQGTAHLRFPPLPALLLTAIQATKLEQIQAFDR